MSIIKQYDEDLTVSKRFPSKGLNYESLTGLSLVERIQPGVYYFSRFSHFPGVIYAGYFWYLEKFEKKKIETPGKFDWSYDLSQI